MNINDAFPSRWIRATDLKGQTHPVVIARWTLEDMGNDGNKPVIYFQGREKGMVLNKTNALCIGAVHGEMMDGWIGKTVELFPAVVMFQGQNVPCIRVRPVAAAYTEAFAGTPQTQEMPLRPQPPQGPGEKAFAPAPAGNGPGGDPDDKILF